MPCKRARYGPRTTTPCQFAVQCFVLFFIQLGNPFLMGLSFRYPVALVLNSSSFRGKQVRFSFACSYFTLCICIYVCVHERMVKHHPAESCYAFTLTVCMLYVYINTACNQVMRYSGNMRSFIGARIQFVPYGSIK